MSARVGPDEHRIRLTLQYDGSGFAGWQVQPGRRTVQGELESALQRITSAPAHVVAAGRTDSGVHATGQVAGTLLPRKWQPAVLQRALNAVLPDDIWVASAAIANDAFHARYDAVARGYVYRLGTADVSRSPFLGRWCWPLGVELSLGTLNAAAAALPGQHSFRAFAKSGQPQRGELCTVLHARWHAWRTAGVLFHIVANRFLHHMVRYLVGTQVDIARGRRAVSDMGGLLGHAPGLVTSRPAPSAGLYLTRVYYQGDEWSAGDIDEILS